MLAGYHDALDRLPHDYELIVVPNACRDDTAAVCRELAAARPSQLQVVELAEGGWGRAVKAGLAQARGDLLCYTNSARTQPEMLTLLLLYAAAYPEVVVKANRRVRDSWRRRLGSVLYNLQCRALFDLPTWDINGTPKVFPRSFTALTELQADDDMIDAEFMAICALGNLPLVEVPVLATVRHGGKSTTNYGSALRMYWGALALRRRLPRS